jgi:hypothetical protein
MNPNIPFGTALVFLVIAYVSSVIFILLASKVGLTVIANIEKSGNVIGGKLSPRRSHGE